MDSSSQRGIALITVLLVMMLMSALLVGFTSVVVSDRRYRFLDQDRGQAFYGASAGVEKLTADLGNLFVTNIAPTTAQLKTLTGSDGLPTITNVAFSSLTDPAVLPTSSLSALNCVKPNSIVTVGEKGYTIMFCAATGGESVPLTPARPINSGPYEGLLAMQTPYQIDVTARTASGGDVHLVRTMQAVAIPVFQFGIFSDVDLSFFAGPDFNFGGRVHTNGNLFLAEGDGATLTLTDKITAVKEVIRHQLANGISIDASPSHQGTVNVAVAPGKFRPLARNEGSIDEKGNPNQDPPWQTTSISTYNTWIRNGATGAKPLNLSLLSAGGSNPDLIRRPATADENVADPVLFGERLYTKASLRILLSDTADNITVLPGVSATPPVLLDGNWNALPPNNATGKYGPIDAQHPPIATTGGAKSMTVQAGSNATQYVVDNAAPFLPAMTLGGAAVSCTVKTMVGFSGCTVTVAAPDPSALTAAGGVSLSTHGSALGTKQAITPVGADVSAFDPLPFWFGDSLVTCTGWSDNTFTGCGGAGGSIPPSTTVLRSHALAKSGIGVIGGYLKIERQDANGEWTDVTMEILNYGIGGDNIGGSVCSNSPDAIVRLQRLRDNGGGKPDTDGGGCSYVSDTTGAKDPGQYWPNVLFDTREALVRDNPVAGNALPLGGVMHYITLDVRNLSRWFAGKLKGTGASARTENGGYTVYFSDRRNNRNADGFETAEYGWEDFVNPVGGTGAANGVLDAGEDVNGNLALDTYGGVPNYQGVASSAPPGASNPLDAKARPSTLITRGQAQVNRAILFRHALKLTNGEDIVGQGVTGLTIVSENPVYIQGNWNANPKQQFDGPHAATAVIADAVTLLTRSWNDTVSFTSPYSLANRQRGEPSWYRVAIIAGKGMAFPNPAKTASDFGTDGGVHNFLRYLQGGDKIVQEVNYRGSIATFYYNRQAVGTFKCCTTVYDAPLRRYNFDTDFLTPSLLPPNTPVFRDLNAVGFAQELRPGR